MSHLQLSRVVRNWLFAYAKTKTQISFAVTAKLISAFVFAIRIVQSLFYLNPKFQASSHLLWLNSPVCVGLGWKSRRPVFHKAQLRSCKEGASVSSLNRKTGQFRDQTHSLWLTRQLALIYHGTSHRLLVTLV